MVSKVTAQPSSGQAPVRSKTLGSLLSVSARDLRLWDKEKETHEEESPKGVLEACRKGVDSEKELDNESSSESPTKAHSSCIPSKPLSRWKKVFKLWKKKSVKCLSTFPTVHKLSIKVGRHGRHHFPSPRFDDNLRKMKSWKIFSLSELQKATTNFSTEKLIGSGGAAEVYKGVLKGGQLVAIKRLTRGTHEEKVNSFLSELGIIVHIDHPNTAKLIGYGVEGGLHLVLQLSSHGSLSSFYVSKEKTIDWTTRYRIALGTADGLLYLHDHCQRRIIHRDIKADNILLTENYEPQICDFGLSKWLPRQCSYCTISKFEGTFGYFAPEYFMDGIVDEKTDVYSFGVLLLELITGRLALNREQSLLLWAKPLLDQHDLNQLVDPVLGGSYNKDQLENVVKTATLCTQQIPVQRPQMHEAVVMLRGDGYCAYNSEENRPSAIKRTYSEELFDAKEYNSTRHLNELLRHRQVAFAAIDV